MRWLLSCARRPICSPQNSFDFRLPARQATSGSPFVACDFAWRLYVLTICCCAYRFAHQEQSTLLLCGGACLIVQRIRKIKSHWWVRLSLGSPCAKHRTVVARNYIVVQRGICNSCMLLDACLTEAPGHRQMRFRKTRPNTFLVRRGASVYSTYDTGACFLPFCEPQFGISEENAKKHGAYHTTCM